MAPAPDPGPRSTRTLPAIESGSVSPGVAAEAARLIREARQALDRGDLEIALTRARRVMEEFPSASGSSEALWIAARAAESLGEHETAANAARRFRTAIPTGHPLATPALMVQGRSHLGAGEWEEGTRVLFQIPADAPEDIRQEALNAVRESASEMFFLSLESLVEEGPAPDWEPLLAPVLAEYALGLYTRSRVEEAREVAERALASSTRGAEAELARSIVEGDVTVDRRSSVVLGAMLPGSGSPTQRQYATLIRQGIEAQIQAGMEGRAVPAELEVRDDSGSVGVTSDLLPDLTELGTVGIIGPLGNETLAAAARARSRPVPMISPTAQEVPDDLPAVYSLGSRDPGAALALARYAAAREVGSAVILHAGTQKHTFDAETFADEYRRLGGTVLRQLSYPPGSTFFEEPFRTVQTMLPEALILPVPVGDIQLIAPQITYFGLDTLGVRVLGTEEWGEPEVVASVEPRHLNGVVVATPRPPGGEMPGWQEFVESFEGVHRQTLRSRIPALGYDAAGLLLAAVARGAREPEEVPRALEAIEAYPGATGFLSVEDGRIVRRYYLMRLREREIIPIEFPEPGAPSVGAEPPPAPADGPRGRP